MYRYWTLALLLISSIGFSQDYMEIIANKSCQCLDQVKDAQSSDEFNVKLGLCMIDAAEPFQAELLEDYGIRFENIEEQGEELGRIIGTRMATVCPAKLMEMAQMWGNESNEKEEVLTFKGKVTGITSDQFVEFSVKNESGQTEIFYWLSDINSDTNLVSSYKTLLGELVVIIFERNRFFDPEIEDYRTYNVITRVVVE